MKRVLLFLFLSVSIAGSQELRINVPYTRFTLPNGLDVILHVDRTTPRVTVNTWFMLVRGMKNPAAPVLHTCLST